MTYLRIMFDNLKNWLRRRSFFVICDPGDNSVTFSKALFEYLKVMDGDTAKVYVFSLATGAAPFRDKGEYGFILNPDFDQETQIADIQYNTQHKTIGFECLVPTVNRIFYDYGLPVDACVKLSVEPALNVKDNYYIILPPKK
jgi:hypothetical protein